MAICAVCGCDTIKDKRSKHYTESSEIKLHSFPKDPKMAKIWERKCGRKEKINVKYAFVCSKHFTKEHYKRNLQHELLNYAPKNYRILKDDAVPTEHLPFPSESNKEIEEENAEALSLVNESIIEEDQTDLCSEVSFEFHEIPTKSPREQELEEKIFELEKQMDVIKKEKELLHTKVLELKHENYKLRQECSATNNIFSATQKKKLSLAPTAVKWPLGDLFECRAIYDSGPKAYCYLLEKGYPFPAVVTLKKFVPKIDAQLGILKPKKKSKKDVTSV